MLLRSKKFNRFTRNFMDTSKFLANLLNVYKILILNFTFRVFIGVKKLLALIDMVKQTDPNQRVLKFVSKLEEEGGLDPISMQ